MGALIQTIRIYSQDKRMPVGIKKRIIFKMKKNYFFNYGRNKNSQSIKNQERLEKKKITITGKY